MIKFISAILISVSLIAANKASASVIYDLKTDTIKHKYVKTWTLKEIKAHKKSDDDCVFTNKYNIGQRLKRYPFFKAAKIVAVSYNAFEKNKNIYVNDTTAKISDTIFTGGLHVKNGKLNYSSLIEIKELNRGEIDKLTNVIYNTAARRPSNFPDPGYTCFLPRNALIFYDKNGHIFDYVQICFECMRDQSLSGKIVIGKICNQEYDFLKKFFTDLGIQYGTIKK